MTIDPRDYSLLLAKEQIDVRSASDLELWTAVLDVYVADVVMAVAEVGNVPARVLDYLEAKELPGNRSRTPEPTPRPPKRIENSPG